MRVHVKAGTGHATKGGSRALLDAGMLEEHLQPTKPTMSQNLDWAKYISTEKDNLANSLTVSK